MKFYFVFFPEFKQLTWFIKNLRHSRIIVKSFSHCLKSGNMHDETRIVVELYDVTGMSEDSRR